MLHEDRERFRYLVADTARITGMPASVIEKDYYVTMLLREIVARNQEVLFKGGTSLSKCYKVIRRFSEDIDLNLIGENRPTEGQRRRLKQSIIDSLDTLGLKLANPDHIKSKREFNRYMIDYEPLFPAAFLKSQVIIETAVFLRAYPYQKCSLCSYIHEYRKNIDTSEQGTFEVCVQSKERTLIDKCFALVDYKLTNRIEGHSRHIYDIYKLSAMVQISADLKDLFEQVRLDRQKNEEGCPSAKADIDLKSEMEEIIRTNLYRDDYENITESILFPGEKVDYDEAIKGLKMLVQSGLFEGRSDC